MKQTGKKGSKPTNNEVSPFSYSGVRIRAKRFDKDMPLPEYQSQGALALDLYAREAVVVPPKESRIIPTNIAIELPDGIAALVLPRSSLPLKTPLIVGNSPGLIDRDYCGDSDEIGVIVTNISGSYYRVEKGFRLGQLLFVPVIKVEFEEVESLGHENRGGFGSTGADIPHFTKGVVQPMSPEQEISSGGDETEGSNEETPESNDEG